MQRLYVLYDAQCSVCRRARAWLERQPAYLPLVFVAAGSPDARQWWPGLDPAATLRELTVVADTGEVYAGDAAWIMCLWALRSQRSHAVRLASPTLRPLARRFVHWISANRPTTATVAAPAALAGDCEGTCTA